MLKKQFLLIISLVAVLFVKPLQAQYCDTSTAITTLEANDITVTLPHAGDFFWDGNEAGYSIKSGFPLQDVHSIFAGGLWISGFDGSDIKQAASTYGMSSGKTDYWPGPLDDLGTTNSEACTNWDRHWKVNREDLNTFLTDANDGEVLVEDIPPSIAAWPARGNALFEEIHGFGLPNGIQGLAPFFDWNANGKYEPTKGDYPEIKGDQAVFWVFNDAGNEHTESEGSSQIRMEVQVMAYHYNSPNRYLNNATYYDLRFISRAISNIEDGYIGLWFDPDLGCPSDDYFGSIPEKNMAFVYNQDGIDGEEDCTCPTGVNTFCDEIPMMGIRMLGGPVDGWVFNDDGELEGPVLIGPIDTFIEKNLTRFTYYNEGDFDFPPATGAPETPMEYHNYLSGYWKDGTPFTSSGTGYDPDGEPTTHAFNGDPSKSEEWSMCSEMLPAGDRKMILSSGPYQIGSGFKHKMSFAIFHVEDVAHPCPSTEKLIEAADVIYDAYNGISPPKVIDTLVNVALSPNPFSDQALLQLESFDADVERVEIYDVAGRRVRSYENIIGNTILIERGNLGSGLYFYILVTNQNRFSAGKFIID